MAVVNGFGPTNAEECLASKILLDLSDAYGFLQDYLTPGKGLSPNLNAFKRTFPKKYSQTLERECEKLGTSRNARRIVTYAEVLHAYKLTAADPEDELPRELVERLGIDYNEPLNS